MALVGSSNLTGGGFAGNTEVNLLLHGVATEKPLTDIVGFITAQEERPAVNLTPAWFERYEIAYHQRPVSGARAATTARNVPVTELAQLDVAWPEFVQLILKQDGRELANGVRIHVLDHEESYLQEIEECQRIFGVAGRFEDIPDDDRRFVAGFGRTSGYFGRMSGAGYYKNLILERPAEIGRLLDEVPPTGSVTNESVIAYLEGALSLHGVALGTATRLLVAKRPDLFLSVNRASIDLIRRFFGGALSTPTHYLRVLKCIWQLPWFSAPMPSEGDAQRIWRVRTAILDALFYETAEPGAGPGTA